MKADIERFDQRLATVTKRRKVYQDDIAFLLRLRYGKKDLLEWVKLDNMLEFIMQHDKDLSPIIERWLKQGVTDDYYHLRKDVDKQYLKNLEIKMELLDCL